MRTEQRKIVREAVSNQNLLIGNLALLNAPFNYDRWHKVDNTNVETCTDFISLFEVNLVAAAFMGRDLTNLGLKEEPFQDNFFKIGLYDEIWCALAEDVYNSCSTTPTVNCEKIFYYVINSCKSEGSNGQHWATIVMTIGAH
mmetsp:Transcript_28680/g.37056  ORF Transcript_28680/g.37056 Transcript_28680/m.37056 type:complete len:142 (+) Transcript_28680:1350-1775(+)